MMKAGRDYVRERQQVLDTLTLYIVRRLILPWGAETKNW